MVLSALGHWCDANHSGHRIVACGPGCCMFGYFYCSKDQTVKTREDIVHSMCRTYRHDYGLERSSGNNGPFPFPCGMTDQEREYLFRQMAQIFDNDIAPYMEFKK